MPLRVCLIVDNPLRDIDGLVLVARNLALNGVQAYLVPMYNQDFDVIAIKPDLVLVNYARPNNIEQLWRFHAAGIRIGILDTEGSPAMDLDDFARNVKNVKCSDFIDLYCLWGSEQYDAFLKQKVTSKEKLHLTGCPRYDYCANPWTKALPQPAIEKNYILINTRFPAINPRFTSGPEEERATMVKAGFNAEWVDSYIHDSQIAYDNLIVSLERLSNRFPEQQFVIRPHPFENPQAYKQLSKLNNIQIRQEGTSVEWINSAKMVIHQNCLTAIEAVMLGCEPISLEWFNTPALSEIGPRSVSQLANSQEELESLVSMILSGSIPAASSELTTARNNIIHARYYANDGKSAQRVANIISRVIANSNKLQRRKMPRFEIKPTVMHVARMIFGYKLFHYLKRSVQGSKNDMRLAAKLFNLEQVQSILDRINNVSNKNEAVSVCYAANDDLVYSRYASGQVVKVWKSI